MSSLCTKLINVSLLCLWQITVADLEAVLTKDQQTFPDNPDIWLKDLASFINIRLASYNVPVGDLAVFEGKSPGVCHGLQSLVMDI